MNEWTVSLLDFYIIHPLPTPAQTHHWKLSAWEWSPRSEEAGWPFSSLPWFKFLIVTPILQAILYTLAQPTLYPNIPAFLLTLCLCKCSSLGLDYPPPFVPGDLPLSPQGPAQMASVFVVCPKCLPATAASKQKRWPPVSVFRDHHTSSSCRLAFPVYCSWSLKARFPKARVTLRMLECAAPSTASATSKGI